VRYWKSLIRERSAESNRIQKVLEGANVKLGSVATRVLGLSGRAMVEALISGVTDPVELADLARGRLKSEHADLQPAWWASSSECSACVGRCS